MKMMLQLIDNKLKEMKKMFNKIILLKKKNNQNHHHQMMKMMMNS